MCAVRQKCAQPPARIASADVESVRMAPITEKFRQLLFPGAKLIKYFGFHPQNINKMRQHFCVTGSYEPNTQHCGAAGADIAVLQRLTLPRGQNNHHA